MGNCQAAEAATVLIQHPGNKVERIYWSVSAREVMGSNPGHYVALVLSSPTSSCENGKPLRHLKLLRPDETLVIGQVYRLVSFEDVLKEFAKKRMKLGKLLKEREHGSEKKKKEKDLTTGSANATPTELQLGATTTTNRGRGGVGVGRHHGGSGGQWKPALQSIAEVGI